MIALAAARSGWVETEPLALARVAPPALVVGNPNLRPHWRESDCAVFVPERLARLAGLAGGGIAQGRRDDNRTAIFPERTAEIDGTTFTLAVKGCGASVDAFEHVPLDRARIRAICHDPILLSALDAMPEVDGGFITGERWFGNTPYGGQAEDNALGALLTSLRAEGSDLNGFSICPIAAVTEFPAPLARTASSFYWYRRYERGYWQELRWMPSNVRMYFHSPVTLGMQPHQVFHLFGLHQRAECERFLENLIASLVAALTLFVRTARESPEGDAFLGLDLQDVWLDKDAVIAPSGRVHFADLEGIEEVRSPRGPETRATVERQFYRNLYEAAYAIESAAAEAERRLGGSPDLRDRQAWIRELMVRALRADPYVRADEGPGGLTLSVEPAIAEADLAAELPWATGRIR